MKHHLSFVETFNKPTKAVLLYAKTKFTKLVTKPSDIVAKDMEPLQYWFIQLIVQGKTEKAY